MNNILIDPIVILLPSDSSAKEEIEAWIANLKAWLMEALSSPLSWLHPIEILRDFLTYEQLPSFGVLNAWQKKYRKDGLDIDIPQILGSLDEFLFGKDFELGSRFDDHLLGLGYVAQAKQDSIIIHPAELAIRWPESIRDEMSLLLIKACACKHQTDEFARKLSIATLILAHPEREVEVSAEVSFLSDSEGMVDQKISQVFPLLFTPDDLPPPTDIIPLWDKGEQGIRYAIDRWYRQDWQNEISAPFAYRFRPCFFKSIIESGIDTSEAVLAKIIRIAAAIIADKAKDIKGYHLRPLRESKAADSKQFTRESDGAKAWRLTITSDGIGWRLHYWQIPGPEGSLVEFANVLRKHDPEEIC